MPALIVYLLKVNVALCLFYIAYRFALRPLTFYYLNRFFLVLGMVFSSAYPFINISALFVKHETLGRQITTIVPDWHKVLPAVQQQAATTDYWKVPILLFWAGVVLMALRLVSQFVSLRRIYKASKPEYYAGHYFRAVGDEINPFSFWQDIYLNPAKHSVNELRSIIQHEQVHIKQWHTLDVVLAELSTVFYWFNPGVWLMKQAVKENLEFITDREILQSGMDEKAYQYSLVQVCALKPGVSIVNNFNFLTIKKRIMMMNKKRSSKAQVTKYVLLLPLVMLLALVFTVSKAELSKKSIAVFVKNILPKATVNALPVKEQQVKKQIAIQKHLPAVILKDTIKPKNHLDTFKTIYITADTTNNGKTITTTTINNGVAVKSAKVISVRVNGSDNKEPIVILDNDNKVTNVDIKDINPVEIESIRVLDKGDTVSADGVKIKNRVVVVKLKPEISVATTTAVTVTSGNNVKPKISAITLDSSSDDEIVSVIDPANLTENELEQTRKLFEKNGFELKFHEDRSGNTLTKLTVSISSKSKDNSASAAYASDDLKNGDYVIRITADKTTGAVSVMSQKR